MRLLFTFLPLLLIVSCTVTKRHFGPGYYVEWKKSHPNEGNEAEKTNLDHLKKDFPKEVETDLIVITLQIDSTDLSLLENETLADEPKTFESSYTKDLKLENEEVLPSLTERKTVLIEPEEEVDQPKRRVDPFTWAALGSLFLGLLLLITIGFAEMTSIVLVILASLMAIFSIISLIRIIRHPELYKAKGLTWSLFWLSMAGISAGLVVLIFYLLVITNNVDLF